VGEYDENRPEWLDDVSGWAGLGPRQGDERPARHKYPNGRWGDTAGPLTQKQTATVVVTPIFDSPIPIGFQLQFSVDGVNFSSVMPTGGGCDVKLTRSLDRKAGPAVSIMNIDPGGSQTMCQVIARSLTITITIPETAAGPVWVNAVACPLTTLDCDAVVPPPPVSSTPAPLVERFITRYGAVAGDIPIAARAKRGYMLIANQSAANLYIALGTGINIGAGTEFATIVLPPGSFSGYNVDNWPGPVTLAFDADDDTGYALVTEGVYA
jgi:hypothetical protein